MLFSGKILPGESDSVIDNNAKHNLLTSSELFSNNQRAVGFGSSQLGLTDASMPGRVMGGLGGQVMGGGGR